MGKLFRPRPLSVGIHGAVVLVGVPLVGAHLGNGIHWVTVDRATTRVAPTKKMNLRTLSERIIYGKYDNRQVKILLYPLSLLSLLYRGVVRIRYWLYRTGVFDSKELPCMVISVGNISLGGSGKTPTTYYIAQLLRENNFHVAILSRGYKGRGGSTVNIVSDGNRPLMSPRDSGDEPYMLARKLSGVPVLASKDRYRLGRYAVDRFRCNVLVLDDGFQHIRLKRDLDILLVDFGGISADNYLLPRGTLREPVENLKRADVFLVTRTRNLEEYREISRKISGIKEDAKIFCGHFQARHLINQSGETKELDYLRGKRVLAFSGIANPEYFTMSLKDLGATVVAELIFPDHHWYSSKDYQRIGESATRVNFAVTTEKDMVKIDSSCLDNLEIFALSIELRVDREEEFKEFLLARVGKADLKGQDHKTL